MMMKKGSKGELVSQVQEELKTLGYYRGAVDGDFGPITEIAVRLFQSKLYVTGELDESDRSMLSKLYQEAVKKKTMQDLPEVKINKRCKLRDNEYVVTMTKKEAITLHLTGGGPNAWFVRDWWQHDQWRGNISVATPYVISGESKHQFFPCKDGEIFELFSPHFWAHHVNSNAFSNSNNIGIEICNLANLNLLRNGEFFAPANQSIVPESQVEELEFRGVKYWHKITDAQIESLYKLLKYLIKKFDIEVQASFDASWSDYKPHLVAQAPKGILTHTNFYSEAQKMRWDIPPFPKLIQMLNSL